MAESLPPSGQWRRTKNSRKRSLEVDEEDQPAGKSTEVKTEECPETTETAPATVDCAICLQTCVHPARLPCGHVFCFLCIKGIVRTSSTCAMCRTVIPPDYLEMPDLLEIPEPSAPAAEGQEVFQWYYEGRHGGWWQYERRMCLEIEEHHAAGEDRFETMICGHLYTVDFRRMVQYRSDMGGAATRRILRELPSRVGVKKGVAGLR